MNQLIFQRERYRKSKALSDAAAISDIIQGEAASIEMEGRVTKPVMDALHQRGLMRLLLPRSIGGAEAHLVEFIEVIEELAKADASTAWCVGQGSGCSFAAAYLQARVANEVFGPVDAVLAWGPAKKSAKAVRTQGGYHVTGAWMFASGSRNAQWLAGHCMLIDDGAPVRNKSGNSKEITALFRKELAEIADVWNVIGLRGTGSYNYAVSNLFVPEEYVFTRDNLSDRREPGTLYKFSVMNVYGITFAAVALGIASALLSDFVRLASRKSPTASGQLLKDNAAVQQQVGYNTACLAGARAYLRQSVSEVWSTLEQAQECSMEQRLQLRMVSTYVIQQARKVVDFAYHAAGSTAIFSSHPFERRFRDMNAVTQQGQSHMANFEAVGEAIMST